MRFVLVEVKWDKALLRTRLTGSNFWTNIDDLIFIGTEYNKRKSKLDNREKYIPEKIETRGKDKPF